MIRSKLTGRERTQELCGGFGRSFLMTSPGKMWSICTVGERRGNTAQSPWVTETSGSDPHILFQLHGAIQSVLALGPNRHLSLPWRLEVLIACQKQHGLLLQNKRKEGEDIHQLPTSSTLLRVELFVRIDYPSLFLEAQLKSQPGCFLVLQHLLPNVPSARSANLSSGSTCPKLTAQQIDQAAVAVRRGRRRGPQVVMMPWRLCADHNEFIGREEKPCFPLFKHPWVILGVT